MEKKSFQSLQSSEGTKINLNAAGMTINGNAFEVKEMHSRGNNSLNFKRKSLSVDLKKETSLMLDGMSVPLRKFHLLNLVMDKYSWHNRWAYLNMSALGIFPLHSTYCTLWINDQPQGIFLLVEKPHEASLRLKSPYMLRRGVQHKIDGEYIDTPSKAEAAEYRKKYQQMYHNLGRFNGEELFSALESTLAIEDYFRWMGFNYLIMNGDYSDELYLYIRAEDGRFDIIPWDYDDIFKPLPHEGSEARGEVDRNRMVFSIEDDLDKKIASDPIIYQHYFEAFKRLCMDLTEDQLRKTGQQVLKELEILGSDPRVAEASRFLDKTSFDMEAAKTDLNIAINSVVNRRNSLTKNLLK
ncbi:MAG: CotH kinase family protein [Bacteroidetes bacterium]|nr:CotH kinase family protein [Bacteroidota bacterium]